MRGAIFVVLALILGLGEANQADAVAWRWPLFCFFDVGSAALSSRCGQIIAAAVASWRREQDGKQYASDNLSEGFAPPYTAHFDIRGYAYDEANAQENQRMSEMRARAVSGELIRLGVPGDLITSLGLGDADPLIPGEPGDPQNRRVQIILR